MKHLIPLAAVVLTIGAGPLFQATCQESEANLRLSAQTAPSPRISGVRAFGGPVIRFEEINGEGAVLLGIRAGAYVSERISLGLAGHGLLTEVPMILPTSTASKLAIGYGGLEVAIDLISAERTTVSVGLLAGGGSVGGHTDDFSLFDPGDGPSDSFGLLEPRLEVGIRVRPQFLILVGGSYRVTTDFQEFNSLSSAGHYLDAGGLSGPSLGIHLKFGHF